MKLLVISHACVLDVNQRAYRDLELMGHEVTVVVPDRWRHEYSSRDIHPVRRSGFSCALVPLPVLNPGSVPLHGYLSRTTQVLSCFTPDVVYIEEEPYSV